MFLHDRGVYKYQNVHFVSLHILYVWKNTIDNPQLTCFPGTYLPSDTDDIETWLLIHLTILLVFQ